MLITFDTLQTKNINLLVEGFWHKELPPILDISEFKHRIWEILKKIDADGYPEFDKNGDFISAIKKSPQPNYVFKDGVEPIAFFEFKKNGTLREMQLPNIKYYCAFIYNTIAVYDSLFHKLYYDLKNLPYVSYSNSYILYNGFFYVHRDYDGDEELYDDGVFVVDNNKTTSQLARDENNVRYLRKQGSKIYSVKIDIESFYPNIYTHYLSRIKGCEPFCTNFSCDEYFDFLDYYNMKINSNQTKGIVTGVFSSIISSELLMLSVDSEIQKALGDDVTYIRYVDDLTFFSDSLELIDSKLPLIQQILNKYRLRINSEKTEVQKNLEINSFVDMYDLKQRFKFFDFDNTTITTLSRDIFYNIKGYVATLFANNKKSEIKAILSMLAAAFEKSKLIFDINDNANLGKHIIEYMIQLACIEPIFASRCYKVIATILKNEHDGLIQIPAIEILKSKIKYINSRYNDSLLQIWHYYVLKKYGSYKFSDLVMEFGDNEINPLIVSIYVNEGEKSNKDLFNYIIACFQTAENKSSADTSWKHSIMQSKWWLPILIMYLKDGYNYHAFFASGNFEQFYKDMKK